MQGAWRLDSPHTQVYFESWSADCRTYDRLLVPPVPGFGAMGLLAGLLAALFTGTTGLAPGGGWTCTLGGSGGGVFVGTVLVWLGFAELGVAVLGVAGVVFGATTGVSVGTLTGGRPEVRKIHVMKPRPIPTPTAVAEYRRGTSQWISPGFRAAAPPLSGAGAIASTPGVGLVEPKSAADCGRSLGSGRSIGRISLRSAAGTLGGMRGSALRISTAS